MHKANVKASVKPATGRWQVNLHTVHAAKLKTFSFQLFHPPSLTFQLFRPQRMYEQSESALWPNREPVSTVGDFLHRPQPRRTERMACRPMRRRQVHLSCRVSWADDLGDVRGGARPSHSLSWGTHLCWQ